MPRKAKQAQNTEESHSEELEVIHEEKPKRPKRKCTEKQLAALAAGRAKNPRFKPKAKPAETAPSEESKEDDASNQCQE